MRQAARKRQTPPGAEPPPAAVLRSSAFYRLHAELAAPDEQHSLLTEALAASSTGACSLLAHSAGVMLLCGAHSGMGRSLLRQAVNSVAWASADNPEERAVNVLTPLHRFTPALGERSASYWSSKGSDDEVRSRTCMQQPCAGSLCGPHSYSSGMRARTPLPSLSNA